METPVQFLDAVIPDTAESGSVQSSHGWKVAEDEEGATGTGDGEGLSWEMLTLTALPDNEIDRVAEEQGLSVEEGGIYQVPEGMPVPQAWASFRLAIKARELEIASNSGEREEEKRRGEEWRNRRVGRVHFGKAAA